MGDPDQAGGILRLRRDYSVDVTRSLGGFVRPSPTTLSIRWINV